MEMKCIDCLEDLIEAAREGEGLSEEALTRTGLAEYYVNGTGYCLYHACKMMGDEVDDKEEEHGIGFTYGRRSTDKKA